VVVEVLAVLGLVLGALALLWGVAGYLLVRRALSKEQAKTKLLERQLNYQGKITSEVAHEIKNPISAVVCAADTLELLLEGQLKEEHRSTLRYIREYGEYVLTIMGDFIDVSRGLLPEASPKTSVVSVSEVVHAVVGLLGASAGSRGVSLTIVEGAPGLCVYADPKHLKQILFNLVHNGIKFTPSGGEVIVGADAVTDSERVLLSVTDTGAGMDRSEVERILTGTTPRRSPSLGRSEGYGIGLLLAQGLIAQAHGELRLQSAPGRGTCVQVLLPRAEPEVGASVEKADAVGNLLGQQPFHGQSVLVVGGDVGARESVRQLIEALGGVVDGVSLATQAVEAVQRKSYTAVLIDEDSVEMDSHTLTGILRQNAHGTGAKIVLASAYDHEDLGDRESTADTVVQKPICVKNLLDSILSKSDLIKSDFGSFSQRFRS
jgi:signal transduction histidine kinase